MIRKGVYFMQKMLERIEGKELKYFSLFSILLLLAAAVVSGREGGVFNGIVRILMSRDALITDYFELAGYGASFLNAALVFGLAVFLVLVEKIPFTGLTMAALFINAGYALWGKNLLNIIPVFIGTAIYARSHGAKLSRYIYTALFGTCLAPLITELAFLFPFGQFRNLVITIAMGVFIGFVLPPLSVHTASMHMGYSLFNVGFSGGILAFIIVSVLRSFGMESEAVLIWKAGRNPWVVGGLLGYFVLTVLFGLLAGRGQYKGLFRIMGRPGRAVSDFVLMDGVGATLMNMGFVGIACVVYIMLIGGDFSGPVVGAILTVFGFSAFGIHIRNFLPPLIGVYLSTFLTIYKPDTPSVQLAALFSAGLAPIAGQFGIAAGLVSGFFHAVVAMCTSQIYGGLNLYNNGFSAGWVAIFMVPVLESLRQNYKRERGKGGNGSRGKENS